MQNCSEGWIFEVPPSFLHTHSPATGYPPSPPPSNIQPHFSMYLRRGRFPTQRRKINRKSALLGFRFSTSTKTKESCFVMEIQCAVFKFKRFRDFFVIKYTGVRASESPTGSHTQEGSRRRKRDAATFIPCFPSRRVAVFSERME